MEIVKIYKENMPRVKLIGKRYTQKDTDQNGTFAAHWGQWFQNGWFDALESLKGIEGVAKDYMGAVRIGENGFEYWIGMLLAPGASAPEGFDEEIIEPCELGVCYLYGNEKSGELYSMEASDLCMAAMRENGMEPSENGWFFERYNCPRFTAPDEKGNVILDICARLA